MNHLFMLFVFPENEQGGGANDLKFCGESLKTLITEFKKQDELEYSKSPDAFQFQMAFITQGNMSVCCVDYAGIKELLDDLAEEHLK